MSFLSFSKGCIDSVQRVRFHSRYFSSCDISELSNYHKENEQERMKSLDAVVLKLLQQKDDVSTIGNVEYAKGFLQFRQDIEKASKLLKAKSNPSNQLILSQYQLVDKMAADWLSRLFAHENLVMKQLHANSSDDITLKSIVEREKVLESMTVCDLKARLSNGRYLFGIFQKDIPLDPLVFVHVALTNDFTSSIRDVDQNFECASPQYCIFYSINSSYSALKNLGLPQLLLRQVKKHIEESMASVHTFSTLSPIPGFLSWLSSPAADLVQLPKHLEKILLAAIDDSLLKNHSIGGVQRIKAAFQHDSYLMKNHTNAENLREPLLWLCAHYLSQETKKMANGKIIPLDDVANFHLRNGASLFRINYGADMSPAAQRRSAGMMVNYLYASTQHKPLTNVEGFSMPIGQSVVDILRCTGRITQ